MIGKKHGVFFLNYPKNIWEMRMRKSKSLKFGIKLLHIFKGNKSGFPNVFPTFLANYFPIFVPTGRERTTTLGNGHYYHRCRVISIQNILHLTRKYFHISWYFGFYNDRLWVWGYNGNIAVINVKCVRVQWYLNGWCVGMICGRENENVHFNIYDKIV